MRGNESHRSNQAAMTQHKALGQGSGTFLAKGAMKPTYF